MQVKKRQLEGTWEVRVTAYDIYAASKEKKDGQWATPYCEEIAVNHL